MSTAAEELTRIVTKEEANARDYMHSVMLRSSDTYRAAYEQAKALVAAAETFTQGDEAKRLAIADAFSQQHRSHQQGFVRGVVIPVLATLEYNAEHNNIDARNQGAANFAYHALAAADEHNAMWMPFI